MIDETPDPIGGGLWWRAASEADLDGILRIQTVAHPLMQERAEVFAAKLRLFPAGCRMLVQADGNIVGYAVAHPWRLEEIPALDHVIDAPPDRPDCLYLHDVALAPQARGRGAGHHYVRAMRDVANGLGLQALALVSVYGNYPVWEACGFSVVDAPALRLKLAPYGQQACYMVATPLPGQTEAS